MSSSLIRISDVYNLNKSKKYVQDVIDSEWLTFSGKYVGECETKLAEIVGVKHALLTSNGTTATHCIIKAIKFKYPECKKIYVQNNSYIAVYNSILMEFTKDQIEVLPIDEETWNLDLNYLDRIEEGAALMIVHNLGNILPVNKIKELRPDIIIVEDNCEGFMGKHKEGYSGATTLCSSLSFYANKHITCGEGGAFLTNDSELYDNIVRYTRHGVCDQKYVHIMHACNYRMSNLNAAMLLSQLEDINIIVEKKKSLYELYVTLLKSNPSVKLQKIEESCEHSYWLIGIKFVKDIQKGYSAIESFFKGAGVEIRPFFYGVDVHTHLQDLKVTDSNFNNESVILLPLHPKLTENNIKYVVSVINAFLNSK
tara:strand:+ start:2022 stop:3125 length:1104 start_codon:yes stop_codon:yes gene_type:complete